MAARYRNITTGEVETGADPAPVPPPSDADLDAEFDVVDAKMQAIVRWCAGHFGLSPAQALTELKPIYRQIRRS